MIHSSQSKDPKTVEAMFSTDLPGTIGANQLPNDLMWMPPGRHTINASRGGKPAQLTVNVDSNTADTVQRALAAMLASAQAGEGDAPYADFNHDDQEASGWAKAFRWAGDDPQRGGVRLDLEWSGAGKRAILGRDYSRFSPSFYANDAGTITGIPVGIGGLVNRAAFQRIAPIMSKRAEAEALASPTDFLTKAKALARARNLELADACDALAHQDPYLYDCYRWEVLALGGGAPKRPERPPYYASAAFYDEFCIQARSLADALDITEVDAIVKLAHAQPALYERYRAKLGLGDQREYQQTVSAAHARAEESAFFVLSKRIAAERSINLAAAFSIAARQSPELYDQYHRSL